MIAECLSRAGDANSSLDCCNPLQGDIDLSSCRLLLDSAAEDQDANKAEKGLLLASAAARACLVREAGGLQAWTAGARRLQQLLMRTMLAMPVQSLRHQAFYALEALLQAFRADIRLHVLEEMLASGPPGVAALLLHSLTSWVSQSKAHDSDAASADWTVIRPRLLPVLEAWILPDGACGWATPATLIEHAEPLCAALNLLRLLLLHDYFQAPKIDMRVFPADRFQGVVSALATTAQAWLSTGDHPGPEGVATMLGLQRLLEVASSILETPRSS
ncbi:hypothetical protein WJX84_011794 [Apatococcus fuscideae]|uniref:Uncharacterized protein n=1 Tax=Apatococcus fuscideae TaxID=2026836 RepID=A0AAW1SL28_9CHLO